MRAALGFTLIELLVALGLIIIVATIGIPAFQDLIRDSRVSSHANELNSMLTLARSEALRRSDNVEVSINISGANVCIDSCNDVLKSDVLKSMDFDRVELRGSESDPVSLVFTNRGYVDGSVTDFALQHVGCAKPSQSRRFRVQKTGQLTIDASNGCS